MKNIENKLRLLFDYQRFDKNKELSKMIKETNEKYENSGVLLLDEASLSFASGGKKEELLTRNNNPIIDDLDNNKNS